MPAANIPVAVHRWFADNEGWAYHPSLRDRLPALLEAVDQELKAAGTAAFVVPWPGGWLVGERAPDRDCLNENATSRLPAIFRVAAVAGTAPPDDAVARRLVGALRATTLPTHNGPHESLLLQLPPEPPPLPPAPPPAAPLREQRPSGWQVLFALLGLSRRPTEPERAAQLGLAFEARWATAVGAGSLEMVRAVLAEDWRGVTADGRLVGRTDLFQFRHPATLLAEFPALADDSTNRRAVLRGDTLVVTGRAGPRRGEEIISAHVYCRDQETGAWQMVLATATPVIRLLAQPALVAGAGLAGATPTAEPLSEALPGDPPSGT